MLCLEGLRELAVKRHAGQLYGDQPYVVHLDAVHSLALSHGLGSAYERAAFGHDLLDDTATTLDELEAKFGVDEAKLIFSVSGPGSNRVARRLETMRRLQAHPLGIDLKLVDRVANLARSLQDENVKRTKMYLDEHEAYAPLFSRGKASIQSELRALVQQATQFLQRVKTIR